MRQYLWTVIFCGFSCLMWGQKYDAHWVGGKLFAPPSNDAAIRELFFSESGTQINNVPGPIGMHKGAIAMSDASGNLQFFTNGNTIGSAINNKIMPNGKGLNPGSPFSHPESTNGYYSYDYYKYAVVPDKREPGVYYQIHSLVADWTENIGQILLTKIDMNLQNGAGDVVYKNKVIYTDSVASPIDVIQHGNGVDWWIVLHTIDGSAYHTLLMEGDSIVQMNVQEVPTFNKYPKSFTDTVWNGFYPITVSTQGDEIVDNYTHRIHRIFDFDRCSGQLNLRDTFETELYTYTYENGKKSTQSALGFAYSPNDRFIYATSVIGYMQWDLEASSINASRVLLSGPPFDVIDSYFVGTSIGLFPLQQGPDGKIYSIFEYTHHIIHHPDEKGAAADMCLASDQNPPSCFGVPYYMPHPHLLNYRMGALLGSVCDSLSTAVTDPEPSAWSLSVRPNPVRGPLEVEVTMPDYHNESITLVLYDAMGRPVHQHQMPAFSYLHYFDTSHLTPGVYILQLQDHQRVMATERVVVME